jgi:tetratricopeptide (TPR) repeat protein
MRPYRGKSFKFSNGQTIRMCSGCSKFDEHRRAVLASTKRKVNGENILPTFSGESVLALYGGSDVQYDLGMVSLRMSLLTDANDAFEQTLKLRPEDAQALYGLGRTKIALASFDDAQQIFQRYLQLRPSDASGHYTLGLTLQALQRNGEAQSEFDKSIELQP